MTKVILNGVEYNLQMGFKAVIEYERLGNVFTQVLAASNGSEIETVLSIGYCMLKAYNKDKQLPNSVDEFIDMVDQVPVQETRELIKAINKEAKEWSMVVSGDIPDVPDIDKEGKEGNKSKNQ